MDPSLNFSDDDDYDVISNPGQRSLESSIAELGRAVVFEPPPTSMALARFETARMTPIDIQTRVQRTLYASTSRPGIQERPQLLVDHRTVRVYLDGSFDAFNAGHALQLRQAKLAFPSVYLAVGVFSDELMKSYGHAPTLPHVERCEVVRHCRWVDEIIPEVPWVVNVEFLEQHKLQYICVEEGITVDPSCDKARLKGYDEMKSIGKVISTRRTIGLMHPARVTTCPPTPTIFLEQLPRTLSSTTVHGSMSNL
ncbi:hypothetical protein AMATHDRAFT_39866 [Amanita thiersii Skay4041]|uniref:choline-phosphate cytidylyltransferase n=1 Tax=Amanita thiersii Skay4041 TaxID=703135 RepID=A0A2A9NVY1_9AGAR|nr:hypothetical protein AMATHDRAFT_39866 [Amanita thiersii Skay4041]